MIFRVRRPDVAFILVATGAIRSDAGTSLFRTHPGEDFGPYSHDISVRFERTGTEAERLILQL
jgi:hypothetical protein